MGLFRFTALSSQIRKDDVSFDMVAAVDKSVRMNSSNSNQIPNHGVDCGPINQALHSFNLYYPLVMIHIAIGNGHRNGKFSLKKW